jgi:hypothetical protein
MPGTDQLVLSTDGGEIGIAILRRSRPSEAGPELRPGRCGAARRYQLSTLRWMTRRRAGSSAGSA